jgi:hypothetical protein
MSGQIFKFLDPKNVDDVLVRGTIRISTLAYFRKLEGVDWIADANEATTVVNAGGAVVTSESEEPQFETWGPAGFTKLFSAKTGGKITFRADVRLSYVYPDCFIFCASQGEREKLIQAMCRDAKQPYEAGIRILLPLSLIAHRLFWRGTIIELDNQPVRRHFQMVSSGPVTYDAIEHHHAAGQAPAPSPFKKHPDFAPQSEVRIVLVPIKDFERDQLTVKLPHPEKIFAEEFRSIPPVAGGDALST